ncbi:GNAT family N-acetyltransferase [Nocardioides sp. SYSU D00065]|uniref:GNAT family N-acetyltransferase n=1 Tax=Nocardioides sp. SYSU D00065 TaxID=2817378 RepID=UPI001B303AB5|nr:GNAT family N-acetyltransferase [Nocardioides sp. SYSU D00065]
MTPASAAIVARAAHDGPASRRDWHELVAADPDALPTQSPEWIRSVCAHGHYVDASTCYGLSDGRRVLLPLVRSARRSGRLSTLDSMPPAWGFGGPLVEGGVTADAVAAVVDDLVARGALRVHLRPNPLHADLWSSAMAERRGVSTRPSCAHVLDLSGGFATVWQQRFKPATRSQVRKAERMGVVVETDTTGRLLPELHALLRASVDRWAGHQHEPAWLAQARFARRDPPAKLRAIADHLGASCQVSVARHQGRAVAAILVLQGRNAHYTRGAMDEELAAQTQANRLLHKVAIEAACRAGCRWYHMGESGASAGLAQFKSRFGAVAHPYDEYIVERVPLDRLDRLARTGVKRALGVRDG